MQKRGSGLKTIKENIALLRENIQWGRAFKGGLPASQLTIGECEYLTFALWRDRAKNGLSGMAAPQ